MLLPLGAALLLAASPQIKVAVPSFSVVGIDSALGDAWAERFVTLLGRDADIKLITARDIQQVIGLDRQKQLLGCGPQNTSCLAELAGALGVDAILSGTFAQAGTRITATLRVLRAADGSQLAAATARLRDGDALQDWLEAQAVELDRELRAAFKLEGAEPEPPSATSGGFSVVRLLPGIAGLLLAGGGAACFGVSKGSAATLKSPSGLGEQEIRSAASTGRALEAAGLTLMIAGGVAVAASVVWVVAAPSGDVQVVFVPTATGGVLAAGGTF